MGREFRGDAGTRAEWAKDGSGVLLPQSHGCLYAADIPAFIEWLQAGPPQKRWRVTRTFALKPDTVRARDDCGVPFILTDADIEEVWE